MVPQKNIFCFLSSNRKNSHIIVARLSALRADCRAFFTVKGAIYICKYRDDMKDLTEEINIGELQRISNRITEHIGGIIEQSKRTVAIYLNSEVSMTYWHIGKLIAGELDVIDEKYGTKIVATLSHQLTWSHFLELITISNGPRRLFYQQMSIVNNWGTQNTSNF